MYRIAALSLPFVLAAGVANAEPLQLTESQLDGVTAGFGANATSNEGSAFDANHLFAAETGTTLNENNNILGVGVPDIVPVSCSPFPCDPNFP